eukprot:182878_1
MKKRVTLVLSPSYMVICDKLPIDRKKYTLLTHLLGSYGMLRSQSLPKCVYEVLAPRPATLAEMEEFHDAEYLRFIQRASTGEKETPTEEDQAMIKEYGLFDDCYIFPELFEYMKWVAGASITAVECLKSGSQIAINWGGGRHHAKRAEASGFCFVNDIVLAILSLLEDPKFERVLYIDLDIHHPDAVEEAFEFSDKVFTLSFHHFAKTFFPGTGSFKETGSGRGKYHCLNIPIKTGVSQQQTGISQQVGVSANSCPNNDPLFHSSSRNINESPCS